MVRICGARLTRYLFTNYNNDTSPPEISMIFLIVTPCNSWHYQYTEKCRKYNFRQNENCSAYCVFIDIYRNIKGSIWYIPFSTDEFIVEWNKNFIFLLVKQILNNRLRCYIAKFMFDANFFFSLTVFFIGTCSTSVLLPFKDVPFY